MRITLLNPDINLEEAAGEPGVLVIYPGRFQPFHKGHKAVYDHLVSKYDNVYIATSDKVDPPRSPFSFEEKKKMMELTGMDTTNVVLTKSPYQALEITQNFDPENTILMFAVSEKDMAEDPRFAFKPKKDGSPSYFQNAKDGNLQPMSKHGYILTVPTFKFDVLGQPMKSATEIRSSFSTLDVGSKKKLIQDLFGNFSVDVFKLMSDKVTESAQHGNHPHRVYGGLDGDIRAATTYLEELLAKVQSVPTGTKVRQRFMIAFNKALNALKGQMDINLAMRENYGLNESLTFPDVITLRRKQETYNLLLSESEIKVLETGKIIPMRELTEIYERGYRKLEENNKMSAQKLGVFAKGKTKLSLWEHNGKVLLVSKEQLLPLSESTVKDTVNKLYDHGYVCESVDMTTMKNAAGAIMNVFFDTIKNTTTVRDQQGGSHTYNAKGDKVIAALQKKGFQASQGDDGGLSLEPMDKGGSQMGKPMDGFV